MLYRPFGKLGWNVSAVSMGTWNIGNQWGMMTDEQATQIVKAAYESGMNLFDTAEAYGNPHGTSELRLGKILPSIRNKVYIVSKIGSWGFRQGEKLPNKTVDSIRLCGHAICGRLKTDYVDAVLCHNAAIDEPGPYVEGFRALVKEGFVRAYGLSTNSFEVFKKFYDASNGECAILEVDYSLVNKSPEADLLPFCREHGVAVLARGPMAQGVLSGRYDEATVFSDDIRSKWNEGQPGREKYLDDLAKMRKAKAALDSVAPSMPLSQAAVRYTISHDSLPVSIPGMTSAQQVKENALAGEKAFTPEEFAAL